jgi:HAD superfamily phosphoserine phosphatase-like hydrolase
MEQKNCLVLDVDETITRINVSFAFGKFLYQKRYISLMQAYLSAFFYTLHAIGLFSIEQVHYSLFRLLFFRKEQAVFDEAADLFFSEQKEQLFRASILKMLDEHRKAGGDVMLLSSSPDFLIRRVAGILSLAEWHATEYVSDAQGFFLTVGQIITGDKKAKIIQDLRQKERLNVTACSDSILDLPLLLEANQAVVVDPDRQLLRTARQYGWEVIPE